ncbi:MAG: CPBP family intramembrane metalloprotease [Deltaproteobacteria bacterium]|nr:CPBP family intramembrane metalloprotease [Deltaproteobacteria bacterium]
MPVRIPLLKHVSILAAVSAIFTFSNWVFFPWVVKFLGPLAKGFPPGPGLLFQHALISCLPQAILCGLSAFLMRRAGLLSKLSFKIEKTPVLEGLIWGLSIAALSVPLLRVLGMPIGFHVDPWSIAGNVFSNSYEEVIFRWFILYGFLAGTGNRCVAIAVSAIAFGLVHDQYPLILRAYVAAVGAALGILATKRNNLIPVVVAHDVADWILDALF